MAHFKDRTGEEILNNQNIKMKIIKYRNCESMDVEFEDGYIAYNVRYGNFKTGNIKNPNRKHSLIKDRMGEISFDKHGCRMEIIRYQSNIDIDVLFDDGTIVKNKTYQQFKKGEISNPNYYRNKRIGEVARLEKYNNIEAEIIEYESAKDIKVYIKELDEVINTDYNSFISKNIKPKKYKTVYQRGFIGNDIKDKDIYITWSSMFYRTSCDKFKNKNHTYKDTFVCEEWHNYQNFIKWFKDNYYEIPNEKMCLDKDILVKGNKIYSPDTCVFVPHAINSLFIKSNKSRGNLPIGVSYVKKNGRYESYLSKYNKKVNLGYYDTIEEAFKVYKSNKEKYIKEVADKYKMYIPEKLYKAMYEYEVDIND